MSGEPVSSIPVFLVVDSDRFVRESVLALFGGDVEVVAVATPDDGRRVLTERHVDVVLADYRMGATDGVQFLRMVRGEHPGVTRMLSSGFLEPSTYTRFLSSGLLAAFIAKPWEGPLLREKIRHTMRVRSTLRSRKLLDTLVNLPSLPTLPARFYELVLAVEDQKPMQEIAALLQHDPAVATRLLHVANSAFFGNRKLTRIEDAVVFLGAALLKDLVLTTELTRGENWSTEQLALVTSLFDHSFAVNRILPWLHRLIHRKPIDPGHGSAGIVHDIGKLVLLRSFPKRYGETLAAMTPGKLDAFHAAEIAGGHSGVTHAEIGGWLLDLWNFPAPLTEVALFHHDPRKAQAGSAHLVDLVTLANRMVHRADGAEAPPRATADDVSALGVAGLTPLVVDRIVSTIREDTRTRGPKTG